MTPQSNLTRHDRALRDAIVIAAVVSSVTTSPPLLVLSLHSSPVQSPHSGCPNSILLAGLLLTPRRCWWLVILAVLPAHFASELYSGVPTRMVLSWFVSNVAQALFAAFFICRSVKDRLRFDRFRDLTIFILFGAFLAPFLSSFLDASLVKLNGWGTSEYWDVWRVRFLSNVLATLTLVPVVMLWTSGRVTALRKALPRRYVEAFLLTMCLWLFR